MPYVGRDAASFTTVVDVTVSDDLTVTDDATIGGDLNVSGATTITTADNTTQLSLISTDADAAVGPVLDLYRNSASPADNDVTGRIIFSAENDADEKTEYTRIITYMPDVSNGSEDAAIQYYLLKDGTSIQRLEHSPTETVFNQDSADVDFRVESNGNANMINVDGGNDRVGIGMVADTTTLTVNGQVGTTNGSAGAPTHSFYGDADTGMFRAGANSIGLSTGGTQRLTVNSSGDIDVETGDIFFSTAGKGIVLGATSNTDANTLHDYEEGTWTPRITASTAGVATAGSGNNGYYTKVGNLVKLSGRIQWTEITTALDGNRQISGLPFTVKNSTGNLSGTMMIRQYNGFSASSQHHAFSPNVNATTADVISFGGGSGSGQNYTHLASVSASGYVYDVHITYIAAD
ncbi:hypothetical protein N9926_01155 [Flavobacteriaceae bacterium]|nr:hypothetical protein [Flavobacteriaceae bacterium]